MIGVLLLFTALLAPDVPSAHCPLPRVELDALVVGWAQHLPVPAGRAFEGRHYEALPAHPCEAS